MWGHPVEIKNFHLYPMFLLKQPEGDTKLKIFLNKLFFIVKSLVILISFLSIPAKIK